jgi:pimeloyl-ACP methyl ester carboxylesterase
MPSVVLLVPGIMGSELRFGDEPVWPGPFRSLIFQYDRMDHLMRRDLAATDLVRRFGPSEQYGALVRDLEACGFDEQATPPTFYACPYDWRRDNREAAHVLAERVDQAAADHAGLAEITLLGHSMGGLIARYYLESGQFDTRPGFSAVRQLVTIGTPHRGSPLALTAALGQERRLFLSAEQMLRFVSDPRFPSLYQLLPPQGEPYLWDWGQAYHHVDVYDPSLAARLGLAHENLEAARAFHTGLDPARRPSGVRYFLFFGTRQTMVSTLLLHEEGERLDVRRNVLQNAGDGTVPVWSAALSGLQGQPVGGAHGTLYKNPELRRTLAVLLGRRGALDRVLPFDLSLPDPFFPSGKWATERPAERLRALAALLSGPSGAAASDFPVEVALREPVVYPGGDVPLVLTLPAGARALEGELAVQPAMPGIEEGPTAAYGPAVLRHALRYSGPAAQQVNLVLEAPQALGVYRVGYFRSGELEPAGSDELFVQQPPATA